MTGIEWTDETWNPVTGCSKVSQGCKNCYAERMHARMHAMLPEKYAKDFTTVQLHEDVLLKPLRWKKHRMVFVNSMSDLFHESVPFEFIDKVFAIMALCRKHTFQILTKRPQRMLEYFSTRPKDAIIEAWALATYEIGLSDKDDDSDAPYCALWNWTEDHWPLPNIWLGVSVEDQNTADERILPLLHTPASIRFLSCEPLLGPIDLNYIRWKTYSTNIIDWVIAGGESGPNARPMHPDWVRGIKDQCFKTNVPFFFKQWGEWTTEYPQGISLANMQQTYQHGTSFYKVGKNRAGRKIDGCENNGLPHTYVEERRAALFPEQKKVKKDSLDNVISGRAEV
jgi:protein gp37